MSISLECPGCAKRLKARDESAGRRVKCPGCGQSIPVPASSFQAGPPKPGPPNQPATIEIQRAEQSWPFRKLNALVFLDEEKEGPLANGEADSFKVSPGSHTVEIEVAGGGLISIPGRSQAFEVTLKEGERAVFEFEISRGPVVDLTCTHKPRKGAVKKITTRRPQKSSGAKILVCGILAFVIGILGIAAMSWGSEELKKMKQGQVDASARGLVVTGMCLGAAGLIINLSLLILHFTGVWKW